MFCCFFFAGKLDFFTSHFHCNLFLKIIISRISYIFLLWNLFETKIVSNGALDPLNNLLYSSPESKFCITGELTLTAPWVKSLLFLYSKIFVLYQIPLFCKLLCQNSRWSNYLSQMSIWCQYHEIGFFFWFHGPSLLVFQLGCIFILNPNSAGLLNMSLSAGGPRFCKRRPLISLLTWHNNRQNKNIEVSGWMMQSWNTSNSKIIQNNLFWGLNFKISHFCLFWATARSWCCVYLPSTFGPWIAYFYK